MFTYNITVTNKKYKIKRKKKINNALLYFKVHFFTCQFHFLRTIVQV